MASPTPRSTHFSFAVAILAATLGGSACAQSSPTPASVHLPHVLVELFTSEGCSDCPPADALLAQLDSTQFIPGAQAIVLSEHVTYWNHLGWRDPFSFDDMDARQREYAFRFSLNDVYTPQMVVDGSRQLVGGDSTALSRAVAIASHTSKLEIDIKDVQLTEDSVRFSARCSTGSNTTLVAALAEDATRSEVAQGENAGRTLHHVAVVRVLKEFDAKSADGRQLRLPTPGNLSVDKANSSLRLVVFLADRHTGHVLGVAQQMVNR